MSVGTVAVLLFIAVALGYMAGRADRIALGPLRWSGRPPFDDRDPSASASERPRPSPPTRLRPRSTFGARHGDRAAPTSDRAPDPGKHPREWIDLLGEAGSPDANRAATMADVSRSQPSYENVEVVA